MYVTTESPDGECVHTSREIVYVCRESADAQTVERETLTHFDRSNFAITPPCIDFSTGSGLGGFRSDSPGGFWGD